MRATARRRMPLAAAALLAALALLAAGGPARAAGDEPAAASGRCGACHPAERVQHERSRHAAEGVRCVDCHGGNDRALGQAEAHAAGFRGRFDKPAIPRLCASCHADEQKMRPYNLPVDQWALYQTSGHGRRLAKGDTRVAVCSDCHGAHEILSPSDPASRVYVLNIPRTCGTCHGDPKITPAIDDSTTVYAAWAGSVHARALYEKGNLRAPTCVSCHGVHGAAPPEIGDVGKVCGRCHTAERRYYAAGPHQKGFAPRGFAECASCHGDHAIQASDPSRLAAQCANCHGAGSKQEKMGAAMTAEYAASLQALDGAAQAIERADAIPLPTEDYRSRLEEGRTYLSEAMPAAHSVKPEVVTSFTSRARAVGGEVSGEIHDKLGQRRWRYVGLALFWVYLLITFPFLRRLRERGPAER